MKPHLRLHYKPNMFNAPWYVARLDVLAPITVPTKTSGEAIQQAIKHLLPKGAP